MYKRQVSARREGGNIRTFTFWGRILGPGTEFFGFWTVFFTYSGSISFRELKNILGQLALYTWVDSPYLLYGE